MTNRCSLLFPTRREFVIGAAATALRAANPAKERLRIVSVPSGAYNLKLRSPKVSST